MKFMIIVHLHDQVFLWSNKDSVWFLLEIRYTITMEKNSRETRGAWMSQELSN